MRSRSCLRIHAIDYSAPGVRLRLKYVCAIQYQNNKLLFLQLANTAWDHNASGDSCRLAPAFICSLPTENPSLSAVVQCHVSPFNPNSLPSYTAALCKTASSHSPTLGYRLPPYLPRDANPIGTLHIGKHQYTYSIAPTCSKRLTVESWQHACSYSLKNRMPSVATIHDFLGKVQYPSSHLCFHGQSATLRELLNRDRVHLLLLPERWPRHIFP